MPEKILVVDDENHIRDSAVRLLSKSNFDAEGAGSGAEALQKIDIKSYDLLLLDIKMPGMDGLELLRRVKEKNPDVMALMITGHGTIENAIEALELGALGFIRKPVAFDELTRVIKDTIEKGRLKAENARLKALMPLFELNKAILAEIDENRLLSLVLNTLLTSANVDTARIYLMNEQGDLMLKAESARGAQEEPGEKLPDEAITKAISSKEPLVCSGAAEPGKPQPAPHHVCIPLVVRNEAIGAVKVTRLEGKPPFKQSDVDFLVTLCGQAAIAIANARLFESVQRKQDEVQRLLKRVLSTTESERLRLSLELHDGPVQSIVAAEYSAEACAGMIRKGQLSAAESKMNTIRQMLAESVRDLRRIVRDLHPPTLGRSGLVSAVQEYMSNLERDNKISCHLDVRDMVENIDPGAERALYYVVREALTNVRKHAEASEVRVTMAVRNNDLTIEIADNGKGFNFQEKYSETDLEHVGLRSMIERAKLLNGNVTIESASGKGTRTTLTVPISAIQAGPSQSESAEKPEGVFRK